jgi:hypothetical protein
VIAAFLFAAATWVHPPPGWVLDTASHVWSKDSSETSEQFGALQGKGSAMTSKQFADSTVAMLAGVRYNLHLVSGKPKTVCGVLGYEVVTTYEVDAQPWMEDTIYVSLPSDTYLTSYMRPIAHSADPAAVLALNSLCPRAPRRK